VEKYGKLPHVSEVEPLQDSGEFTSVTLYRDGGSYFRVELDPGYFRKMQKNAANDIVMNRNQVGSDEFKPNPSYLKLFAATLDLFHRNHIRLIVSEIEEAPFHYSNGKAKEAIRRFMKERIKPLVNSSGFPYVRVDFDALSDDDYFDYNHLNSVGGVKFDSMLSDAIRPYVLDKEQ
jgi:hypothetical protein